MRPLLLILLACGFGVSIASEERGTLESDKPDKPVVLQSPQTLDHLLHHIGYHHTDPKDDIAKPTVDEFHKVSIVLSNSFLVLFIF